MSTDYQRRRSRGVQIICWMDDELVRRINAAAAAAREDRSAWLRRKCAEALERGERPAFAEVESDEPEPTVTKERKETTIRW